MFKPVFLYTDFWSADFKICAHFCADFWCADLTDLCADFWSTYFDRRFFFDVLAFKKGVPESRKI